MHYDFSTVQDLDNFATIPEGSHLCRVATVRTAVARDGSEQWRFMLVVAEGDWAGRTAGWDSITWSERGIYRVKHVLAAFGFDVQGEVELDPQELLEQRAMVTLRTEEWEDPGTGRRQVHLRVPYQGYRHPEAVEQETV